MNLLVFTACILTLTVLLLLIRFGIRAQKSNGWLALFIFSQTTCLLTAEVLSTDLVNKLPHFIRLGNFFAYLWMPSLYLYVRHTFYPGKPFSLRSMWVFLPALIYVIDYFPFFLLSGEKKLALFRQSDRREVSGLLEMNGWLLHARVHYVARAVLSFIFLIKTALLIWQNRRFDLGRNSRLNLAVFRFVILETLFSAPFVLLLIIAIVFRNVFNWNIPYKIGMGIPSFLTPIFLLLFPRVLYGFVEEAPSAKLHVEEEGKSPLEGTPVQVSRFLSAEPLVVQKSSVVSAVQKAKLVDYMESQTPYLEQGLSIHSLSEKSGIPVYVISQILNQGFGLPFNQWVNSYRVRHFQNLLEDEQNKTMTLEFLGLSSGFKNRATFIAAVKKETGQTPGAILKSKMSNELVQSL